MAFEISSYELHGFYELTNYANIGLKSPEWGEIRLTTGESPSKMPVKMSKALKGRYIITPFQGYGELIFSYSDGLSPVVSRISPHSGLFNPIFTLITITVLIS